MRLKNKQIIIETTNLCDAKCVTCPREKFTQKPCTMDLHLFSKIIQDASHYDIESIDMCGYGEPLLDKFLFERLDLVRTMLPQAHTFLSTTGFHLTPDKWDKVIRYVDTIKFSIYGTTKHTYESAHRGKLKYSASLRNILGFLGYCYGKHYRPHTIGLYLNLELNAKEQDDWIELWEPAFDEVMIWKPHNWINGRTYRVLDKTKQVSCGRPENAPFYIHADGKVSPCCFDPNKLIVLGDMKDQTIEEVYKGEAYHKLREAHRAGDFSSYACRECDQTNYNPGVLVYSSNKERKVGQLVSNNSKVSNGI